MICCHVESPVGRLRIVERDEAVVSVTWSDGDEKDESTLLTETCRQLRAYFDSELSEFDLPLATAGLVSLSLGKSDRARDLFSAGLEAATGGRDLRVTARYHGLLGMADHACANWEPAAQSYRAALDLADRAGDRHGAATYAVNLAAALSELDRVKEALDGRHEVLGHGALLGVRGAGPDTVRRLREEHRVLAGGCPGDATILRLLPPLTLTDEELDEGLAALEEVLA